MPPVIYSRSRSACLFSLAFLAGGAHAQDPIDPLNFSIETIGAHAVSLHQPSNPNQKNINPGLYARLRNGVVFGAFQNTYSKTSVYLGYQWNAWGPIDLMAGGVSGYSRCDVCPMIAANVKLFDLGEASPRLFISRGSKSWVANLALEYRFD